MHSHQHSCILINSHVLYPHQLSCTLLNSYVPKCTLMYGDVLSLMYPQQLSGTQMYSCIPSSTLMYPPQLLCTQMYSHVWGCTVLSCTPTTLRYPSSTLVYPRQLSCTQMYSCVPSSTLKYPHQLSWDPHVLSHIQCTVINSRHQLSPSTPLCSPHLLLSFDWENQFESNFHTNSCLSALHQLHSH